MNIEKATELLRNEIQTWYEIVVKALPNFVLAILVLTCFYLAARLARQGTKTISKRVIDNKSVIDLLSSMSYILVIGIGISTALGILNLDKTVSSLLAGAGVLGLAIGFAFQEISANFIAGVILAFRKPFTIGSVIKVADSMGVVDRVNLRSTVIKTFQGQYTYIPNKFLITNKIENYSENGERLLELQVGVGYETNLKFALEITKKAVQKVTCLASDKEPEVYFREFGASSINLVVRYWIKYPQGQNYFEATNQAILNIKESYDQNEINIPFPIRTLEFNNSTEGILKSQLARKSPNAESDIAN